MYRTKICYHCMKSFRVNGEFELRKILREHLFSEHRDDHMKVFKFNEDIHNQIILLRNKLISECGEDRPMMISGLKEFLGEKV